MWQKIKCFLGWHEWKCELMSEIRGVRPRVYLHYETFCKHCGKVS